MNMVNLRRLGKNTMKNKYTREDFNIKDCTYSSPDEEEDLECRFHNYDYYRVMKLYEKLNIDFPGDKKVFKLFIELSLCLSIVTQTFSVIAMGNKCKLTELEVALTYRNAIARIDDFNTYTKSKYTDIFRQLVEFVDMRGKYNLKTMTDVVGASIPKEVAAFKEEDFTVQIISIPAFLKIPGDELHIFTYERTAIAELGGIVMRAESETTREESNLILEFMISMSGVTKYIVDIKINEGFDKMTASQIKTIKDDTTKTVRLLDELYLLSFHGERMHSLLENLRKFIIAKQFAFTCDPPLFNEVIIRHKDLPYINTTRH